MAMGPRGNAHGLTGEPRRRARPIRNARGPSRSGWGQWPWARTSSLRRRGPLPSDWRSSGENGHGVCGPSPFPRGAQITVGGPGMVRRLSGRRCRDGQKGSRSAVPNGKEWATACRLCVREPRKCANGATKANLLTDSHKGRALPNAGGDVRGAHSPMPAAAAEMMEDTDVPNWGVGKAQSIEPLGMHGEVS
jgi:hypothetical protein